MKRKFTLKRVIKSTALLGLIPLLLFCQNSGNSGQTEATTVANQPETSLSPEEGQLASDISLALQPIAEGLKSPIALEAPLDGSGRMFVVSQAGTVHILKNGEMLEMPFLDISSKLDKPNPGYSEKGLLGLAFHPQYKSNGRFFVYYSAPSKAPDSDHKSVIAEYQVSRQNPDIADPVESVVLEFEQPESNHNGGQLAFGPDGMLYIGSGDGGGAGDKHGQIGNGQDLSTLLGKILRINVDARSRYAVPDDNPFRNTSRARPEIWAYGLRNPWRFSFDRQTGQLFAADVGQNKYEEVDIIEKGKNYGWRIMEGRHCFNPETNCNTEGLVLPIFEYPHSQGISGTGGFVYRGNTQKALQGKYVFGDWNGRLFVLQQTGSGNWQAQNVTLSGNSENDAGLNINSFGQDEQGELYLVGQKNTGPYSGSGGIYRIAARQD